MARTVSADTLVTAGGATVSVAALVVALSGVQAVPLSITTDEAAPQIALQDVGADSWIEFAPVSADAHVPSSGIRVTSNVLNGFEDQVMMIGHSVAGGSELGKIGLWLQLEQGFLASPGGSVTLSEMFFQWRSPAGLQLRPMGCTVQWENEQIVCGVTGQFNWSDEAGTQLARFDRNGLIDLQATGGGLRKLGNNTGFLYGQKADGSLFEFLRVHDSNWLLFDVNQQYGGLRTSSPGGIYTGLGTPSTNACLQSDSTTKGWQPPRWSTVQRQAIPAGVNDRLIGVDTNLNKLTFWNGTQWQIVTSVAE